MKKIVIAGIGNVLLGDDGLGPYTITQLAAHYDFGPEVELMDAGTPSLDFASYFPNADLLLVIDGVKSPAPAGTILRYGREEILYHSAPLRVNAHSPALGHALQFGKLADNSPRQVYLLGIAVADTEPGTKLSDAVRAAIPMLMEAIATEIRAHGGSATHLEFPRPVTPWWEEVA